MINLVLEGQALSTQTCYRSTTANGYNRSYMTQKCVDLKQQWAWAARTQYRGKMLEGEVVMEVTLYHGNKIKRDIDNFNKLLFDALTGIIYEDDSQVCKLIITRGYDKERPRVEVVVYPHPST